MGNFTEWIRKCIEDCRCKGETNTQNKAEVLMEKFAQHMDENAGGGTEILWTNPNPKSEVDISNGLTITADISAYRYVMMLFRHSASDDALYAGYMLPDGEQILCYTLYGYPDVEDGYNVVKYANACADYSGGVFTYWGADIKTFKMGPTILDVASSFTGDVMIPQVLIGYK